MTVYILNLLVGLIKNRIGVSIKKVDGLEMDN